MTTRYGQKDYGTGAYSGPDTLDFTAAIGSAYTTSAVYAGDFEVKGLLASVYNIINVFEVIGPMLATLNTAYGISAVIQRERPLGSTVSAIFGASVHLNYEFELHADVVFVVDLFPDPYIGPQWVDENISGSWAEIVIPSSIWVDENIPPVEWRN